MLPGQRLGSAPEARSEDAPRSPLGHSRRRAAFEHIQVHPGPTLGDIARLTGMTHGPAYHHLRVLEKAGLITRRQDGRCIRFFEAGSIAATKWQHASARRDPGLAALLDVVADRPGATQGDLVDLLELLGWARSTTQYRLRRLERAGLLSIQRAGREHRYWPQGLPSDPVAPEQAEAMPA